MMMLRLGVVLTAALASTMAAPLAAQQRAVETIKTSRGDVKVTPVRHASVMLEYGGKIIHIDPWSQGNYTDLPKADLVLITDIHGDHMDPKALALVRKEGTRFVAPAAVKEKGVPEAQMLANGQSTVVDGVKIEAVPMYNLQRGPQPGTFFHDKGRGNGYVLTLGDKRLYFSGDTECVPEIKELKNIDVAFITMNLPYTMPPDEAAACVKAFKPKVVYPYHFRGSDLKVFEGALKDEKAVEVRVRDWYY